MKKNAIVRLPLTALASVLYAAGFAARKVFVEAPTWTWTAVRLGWRDGAK